MVFRSVQLFASKITLIKEPPQYILHFLFSLNISKIIQNYNLPSVKLYDTDTIFERIQQILFLQYIKIFTRIMKRLNIGDTPVNYYCIIITKITTATKEKMRAKALHMEDMCLLKRRHERT